MLELKHIFSLKYSSISKVKIKAFTKIFKRLVNKRRIDILKLLLYKKEMELEKIIKRLRRPYKTIARHLKILEHSNLVESGSRDIIAYCNNLVIPKTLKFSLKKVEK